MTKAEVYSRQDEAITAAELCLELISTEERNHFYVVAEFSGANRLLDQIEPPYGKKDEKSLRELYVACALELLRRATALRPVRVEHFTKA